MTLASRIKKIGFFRFVHNLEDPIGALIKAIDDEKQHHSDIGNSLVVLPEAFNYGRAYGSPGPDSSLPADEILDRLCCELAEPFGAAFVVGVIDIQRRNSAYWVDADGPKLICHKVKDDGTNAYDPCLQEPDLCNPIVCGNASVGVLICVDATHPCHRIQQRRDNLLVRLREGAGHKILCVPAQFTRWAPDPSEFLAIIPDYWYVVADGKYLKKCFVAHAKPETGPAEMVVVEAPPPEGNRVRLWPLS